MRRVTCEYCGCKVDSESDICSHCGATVSSTCNNDSTSDYYKDVNEEDFLYEFNNTYFGIIVALLALPVLLCLVILIPV